MKWKTSALGALSCLAIASTLMSGPAAAAPAPSPSSGAAKASPTKAVPAGAVTNVVIVPGQTFGAFPYQPLAMWLKTQGYQVDVLSLNGTNLPADAQEIAGVVNRIKTENPKATIGLVGHSVGGLSTRYYLTELGGSAKVARYIAIGTPQYGNPAGCTQAGTAKDVCPTSPFLKKLNSGTNTAGPTKYYSIRSNKEWVDGRLTGSQCRMVPVPSATGSGEYDHIIEPMDPRVMSQIQDALAGRCDGQWASDAPGSINVNKTLYPGGKQASGA
jgi:triacylglycerol lipase